MLIIEFKRDKNNKSRKRILYRGQAQQIKAFKETSKMENKLNKKKKKLQKLKDQQQGINIFKCIMIK